MRRPLYTGLIFAACALLLLAAMGWASWTVLRLEAAQQRADAQAEIEEKVRLALWRMDSGTTALITEENSRPYFVYDPFYSTDRAYTRGFAAIQSGDVLIPSPLLTFSSSNVLVHFQFGPDGRLTSPQVPVGHERTLAQGSYTTPAAIERAAERLNDLQRILNERNARLTPARTGSRSSWLNQPSLSASGSSTGGMVLLNRDVLANSCQTVPTNFVAPLFLANDLVTTGGASQQGPASQVLRSGIEQNARANVYSQSLATKSSSAEPGGPPVVKGSQASVREGTFTVQWIGEALVLARRVEWPGSFRIQGCWLNWPVVQQSLLGIVNDLLPDARLEPMEPGETDNLGRQLVSLPVRLEVGAAAPIALARWTPLRMSLAVAWSCVLVAALAVAMLLYGAVSLSERRAAFVSAVTHELRTPLTTFRMYSEMLAEGMVTNETQRRDYLATLCLEANRLSHLVENVLAYARLERGSARRHQERVTLSQLIEPVRERLAQRAAHAGLTLVVDADERAAHTVVHVDLSAVEQILFNLVDNACKYAAPTGTERLLHLEARTSDGPFALLRVRDHGPGIRPTQAKRLFKPFSKSAHEAAHTAPGVGLGLALCRRLSRSMGGDLRLDPQKGPGACFVLSLPLSPSAHSTAPA